MFSPKIVHFWFFVGENWLEIHRQITNHTIYLNRLNQNEFQRIRLWPNFHGVAEKECIVPKTIIFNQSETRPAVQLCDTYQFPRTDSSFSSLLIDCIVGNRITYTAALCVCHKFNAPHVVFGVWLWNSKQCYCYLGIISLRIATNEESKMNSLERSKSITIVSG